MSAVSAVPSVSESIQMDYMNLLVAQLRHQDPMEPMSSGDMSSQLAQLAQLQRITSLDNTSLAQLKLLENIDSSFSAVMTGARLGEASAMIGKQVSFFPKGSVTAVTDVVDGVEIVDDRTTRISNKRNGRVSQVIINTLSEDGNTISNEYVRMDENGAIVRVTHAIYERVR